MTSTGVRPLTRALTGTVAGLIAGATLITGTTVPADATDSDLPPARKLVRYTVQPGDTATGLAVRFHAWTAELVSHNHLGAHARVYAGQRIVIPVDRAAAARAARTDRTSSTPRRTQVTPRRTQVTPKAGPVTKQHPTRGYSRAKVRQVITQEARRHGVDRSLALAVSWQEAGWRMHHVSHANAIGAMQVLPSTATWMSGYAGRPLDLRRLRDNVTAGVLLLKVLDERTSSRRDQVAAYYQGLGAVQRHGLYRETRQYVANVLAIRERLRDGWHPET